MVYIDKVSILRKVSRSKKVNNAIQATADRKFKNAKKEMFRQFEIHDVTLSLENKSVGGDAGMLEGKGSLWGFLGLSDENPVGKARDLLDEYTTIEPGKKKGHGREIIQQEFDVSSPTPDLIDRETPLSWGGGSWATAIEKGFNGLARFIYWKGGGRSGGGFQAKKNVRSKPMASKDRAYLSEIVAGFRESIRKKFK